MTSLDQLKEATTVVADTGDFEGKSLYLVSRVTLIIVSNQIIAKYYILYLVHSQSD